MSGVKYKEIDSQHQTYDLRSFLKQREKSLHIFNELNCLQPECLISQSGTKVHLFSC